MLILVVRLVLAATFAVAGIAKLADGKGSRQAMIGFGLPARWAGAAGLALSVSEVLVAIFLLPSQTAWVGALGALALLIAFIGAIGFNLAQGRTPDCHCFGQLHSKPIGWQTLVRNGVLALLAAYLVAQGPTGIPSVGAVAAGQPGLVIGGLILGLLLLAVAAIQSWFMYNLVRQNGRLLLRVEALEGELGIAPVAETDSGSYEGLAPGTTAPSFRLPDVAGEQVALNDLLAQGKPLLLVFSDPDCTPCRELLPDVAHWQTTQRRLTFAVISRGSTEANGEHERSFGLAHVLLQDGREVSLDYGSRATPSAVLIDVHGKIASPLALGPDAIRDLVDQAVLAGPLRHHLKGAATGHRNSVAAGHGNGSHAAHSRTLELGSAAPHFHLPTLDGTEYALAEHVGAEQQSAERILLFWNPGCSFCQRMLPKLREWEATRNGSSPRLVLISTGASEAHSDYALRAPILMDAPFAVGREYGVQGTPSALLVDSTGRVASEMVVGEPAILNLMRGGETLALTSVRSSEG